MCDLLIFSKDRACQLDALLRSIAENGPAYSSVTVLFDYSSAEHCGAYAMQRRRRGADASWPEDDFYMQVMAWLAEAGDTVSFLVDDQVFYRAAELAPEPGVVYQYGENCVRSQTMGCEQSPNVRYRCDDGFEWYWRGSTGDFGYPLSIGGNVYDKRELLEALPAAFDSPTTLEAGMACYAAWWSRETLTAPAHSCLVSLPLNRVTTQATNPISDNPEWSADAMCDRFLEGWRMDWQRMDYSGVDAAHVVIPPVWTRV